MTFSPDYETARARFREAADRLGWTLHAYPIGSNGPKGENLTIDVAVSSPTKKNCVLVLSSGLHGVEGFFGSAVQLAFLERWQRESGPPADVRYVLLHGLNPFGFAWSRRFDAGNIDPNRNFLLDGEAYSGSPAEYSNFDVLLNPRRPPANWDPLFYAKALWAIACHGKAALKQALVTGQYDFPKGLFFGGNGPSRTKEIVQEHFKSWVDNAKIVAHLDFHTGLGPWGACKLLTDYKVSAAQHERLIRWFGEYEANDPKKTAYQPRGSFGQWCVAQNLDRTYVSACAEFGTYGNLAVLAGLRAENQAHHWAPANPHCCARAKERLRELFCPVSGEWRSRVVANSMDLVNRAVNGLIEEAKQ
ncbi:MAG TPA: M14 family metallopeptidase [Gemmataceae bacterium]|nr:M14 family metallopeptidase [Gemmataceae bacterium]